MKNIRHLPLSTHGSDPRDVLLIRRCFFLALGTSVRTEDPTLDGTEHGKFEPPSGSGTVPMTQ